jgi:hypothetical protein
MSDDFTKVLAGDFFKETLGFVPDFSHMNSLTSLLDDPLWVQFRANISELIGEQAEGADYDWE